MRLGENYMNWLNRNLSIIFSSSVLAVTLIISVIGQEPNNNKPTIPAINNFSYNNLNDNQSNNPQFEFTNKVEGLELPKDIIIPSSQPGILITAKCESNVSWLVISKKRGVQPFYYNFPQNKTVVLFTYNEEDVIDVYACACHENNPTKFARTRITVIKDDKQSPSKPIQNENPPKNDEHSKEDKNEGYFVVLVFDFEQNNQQYSSLVTDHSLRARIREANSEILFLDHKSDTIKESKGFTEILKTIKGLPAIVIQKRDGSLVYYNKLPPDKASLYKLLIELGVIHATQ